MSFINKVKKLYLMLTYNCNLDCPFCSIKPAGFFNSNLHMPEEIAYESIDVLLNNSLEKELEIRFFGGEPLLKFDLIEKIVKYIKQKNVADKNINFSIATNGTLINDRIIDFFSEEKFMVNTNLDGAQDLHDSLRFFSADKKGTYEIIMKNLNKMQNKVKVSIDCHISPNNLKQGFALMKDIENLTNTLISFRHIHNFSDNYEMNWKLKDYDFYEETCLNFAKEYKANILKQKLPIISMFLPKQQLLNFSEKQFFETASSSCSAAKDQMVVVPSGDIFPCYTFAENNNFCIGNIYQGINTYKLNNFSLKSAKENTKLDTGEKINRNLYIRMPFCPYSNWCDTGKINKISQSSYEQLQVFYKLYNAISKELNQ